MADVFISYHRSKRASALVRRIAIELKSRGVSCWYDTKSTRAVDFIDLIVTEINRCKVFLFIWDVESNKMTFYVRHEVHMAATAERATLVPFRVGKFNVNPLLKFYFGPINTLYGGNSIENANIKELVNAIVDAVQPPPAKIIMSSKCGENVVYSLNKNGVLTISGDSAMWDFEMNIWRAYKTPWKNKRKMISLVNIQYGVTTIGRGAFNRCVELTSVNIPDSVTFIGEDAFGGCAKLTTVSVPANIEIEDGAFPYTVRVARRVSRYSQKRYV